MSLQSIAGWRGKTVHSWMFADAQEEVFEDAPARLITVHGISTSTGEKVVCTNMAGQEVAAIAGSLQRATFAQVKAAVAKSCCCVASDVQLLAADGQVLHGLDSWTLAESKARNI